MKMSFARIALFTLELSVSIAPAQPSATFAKLATFLPQRMILRKELLLQQRSGAEPAKNNGESTVLSALSKHALRLWRIKLSLMQSQVKSSSANQFRTVLTMPVTLTDARSA